MSCKNLLRLKVLFVVDVGKEHALLAVGVLVEGVVPVLSLYQHVLDPGCVGPVVEQTPNVVANQVVLSPALGQSYRKRVYRTFF